MTLPSPGAAPALAGLTVIEYSNGVAGAYCGRLLAMYGARVVLVEPPEGSRLRKVGPFRDRERPAESGALFITLAAGKEGVTLNLASDGGRTLFRDLCETADALITDSRAELDQLGVDWEGVHRRFPRLLLASVSAFGDSGPYAGFADGPGVGYALGGYTFITGDPEREPLAGPEHIPGYIAGVNAYIGVLSALLVRERTGRGQLIEVSALEVLASAHQWTITRFAYNGQIQRRDGNRYDSLHPVTYYECSDGTVAVSPSTPDQLERMMFLIGREDMLEDPRFATNFARIENADAFDEGVAPWFRERTRAEVTDACQEFRVPCAPALEVDDLLGHEQLVARGFWRESSHPVAGEVQLPGLPFRLPASETPAGRAPLLGEHNHAVYRELASRDEAALATLRTSGVI